MTRKSCPYCEKISVSSYPCTRIIRFGFYYRTSDKRYIQRYRCLDCRKCFSSASLHPCFGQRKRQINKALAVDLSSGMSLRRSALVFGINVKTSARKLVFLGQQSLLSLAKSNLEKEKAKSVEFDDLETFEHTKCKPLSITLAVETKSRRILGFEVSSMPSNGPLAAFSRRKYGYRKDERAKGRRKLFKAIRPLIADGATIKSDSNPHYKRDVKRYFPDCRYRQFEGKRGSSGGQGELKKVKFDPLFSLNHTCAKFRADINRLFRKTWCTTKRADRLFMHLAIYAEFHNREFAKSLTN